MSNLGIDLFYFTNLEKEELNYSESLTDIRHTFL